MSVVRCKICGCVYAITEHVIDKSDYTCKNCTRDFPNWDALGKSNEGGKDENKS